MKISVRLLLLFGLLLAAIGYTVFNWVTGQVDSDAAILYILVLSFPIVRYLSAFLKQWKSNAQ